MKKVAFCSYCQEEVETRDGYCPNCELPLKEKRKKMHIDPFFTFDYDIESEEEIDEELDKDFKFD